ncbi:hypothetical protein [Persephonella sp.]
MFVKIEEDEIINLETVDCIRLDMIPNGGEDYKEHPELFYWKFYTSTNEIFSKYFKTRKEALKWFQDNIEPVIKDYNNAKFAPHEQTTYLERISVILEELVEKQEV